jgi:hypothetical protein
MTIYLDPAGPYPHPTLFPALMSVPAKEGQHQHENQATEILAWLIDRSDVVARAVGGLFLGDLPALRGAERIAARTQISLPRPSGGTVFPDLSIEGASASFQLLVEVKIGAQLSESPDADGGVVKQDDVYRQAWAALDADGQAAVRAVGTLTRHGGPATPQPEALCARDVSWSALRAGLAACVPDADAEVRAVLASFVDAIDVHIAVEPLDHIEVASWLRHHESLVALTATRLADRLAGIADAETKFSTDYASRYVRFVDTTAQELRVRVYVTPAGGRLNLPGHPDALAVYLGRDTDATLEKPMLPRLQAAGFVMQKDIWGFKLCRRHFEIPAATTDHRRLASTAAEQVGDMLHAAELVPSNDA